MPPERCGVNLNAVDQGDKTPLSIAAQKEYEGVVKILLGRNDVKPGIAHKYGQVPLFEAAGEGHQGVVKMLLEHVDVNSNMVEEDGRTPLFIAARKGCDSGSPILAVIGRH